MNDLKMKLLITMLIISILSIINCANADEWEDYNKKRCDQGIQTACEILKTITDIEECSNPKQKQLVLTFDKEEKKLRLRNEGYKEVVFTIKDNSGIQTVKMYPCDSVFIDTSVIKGER